MEAEQNLLKALQYLDSLMVPGKPDAGSGLEMGLTEFLGKYNCKMITYLAQVLKRDGYVKQVMQSKSSLIFWNKKEKPSMTMCEQIVSETRAMKGAKTRPATERQRNDVIKDLLTEAEIEKLDLEEKIREKNILIAFLKTKIDE